MRNASQKIPFWKSDEYFIGNNLWWFILAFDVKSLAVNIAWDNIFE